MLKMTEFAINKVLRSLNNLDSKPLAIRIAVVGGGCSGFSYSMQPENEVQELDKVFEFEGTIGKIFGEKKKFKILVDQASLIYLDNCEIDYVETLEGSGFKFNNSNVKSTCGCGSSFST